MSRTSDDDLSLPLGVLTLLELRGVGPQAVSRLAQRFASVAEVVEARAELLHGLVIGQGRTSIQDRHAVVQARGRAMAQLEKAHALAIDVLTPQDERYPEWLRLISDRPPVLYLRGELRPGKQYVACVGTREPTSFGIKAATSITRELATSGWSVVSGLALGVDAICHRAALDAGGHTVAVLANGLEGIYPKANERLGLEILDRGGALIGEQPVGVPAIPRNLVQRDRLQSGMSAGTVVMQTDVEGGSMHTVRFTLMQGRRLFAPVPTGEYARDPKSQGIVALTQQSSKSLVSLLKIEDRAEYAAILTGLGERPAAVGLRSKDDYPLMLRALAESRTTSPPPSRGVSQLAFKLDS